MINVFRNIGTIPIPMTCIPKYTNPNIINGDTMNRPINEMFKYLSKRMFEIPKSFNIIPIYINDNGVTKLPNPVNVFVIKVGNVVAAFGIQIKNGIAIMNPQIGAGKKCFQSI